MDKRTKVKAITTIICLILSVFALYTFIFVADVSNGWRIVLIIINILDNFWNKQFGRIFWKTKKILSCQVEIMRVC